MKLQKRRLAGAGRADPGGRHRAWPRAAGTTPRAATTAAVAVAATSRSRCCPRASATPTSTPAPPVPRRPPTRSAPRRRGRTRTPRRPDAQVPFINTAAQQGVGALIVSANDPTAICDALDEARDAGTKVVTFDSDTDPECRDLFINQATAEGIAKVQVELIAEQIGDSGEIAILSAAANATNQNAWIDMMEDGAPRPEPPGHRARRHGLRRRRRPEVVRPDRGAAAVAPRPQGHHLADHGRHRGRRPLPVRLGREGQGHADRPRHAEPDARVRRGRHRHRPSRSGTRATWATSRRTPPTPWPPTRSPASPATPSRPATSASTPSRTTASVLLGDPFVFDQGQHRRLRLLSRDVRTLPAGPAPALGPAGSTTDHRSPSPVTRGSVDATRLLPAPGPAATGSRSTASATPRSGRTCSARCTRPAGTTTRCSCATTDC